MRVFLETVNRTNISVLTEIPSHIEYRSGFPTTAHFSNGEICSLGCIGCINPKCMRFDLSDIMCDEVKNFPSDQSLNVCPVDALQWDYETDMPTVNTDKCITCGICVSRCPVGAIYFDNAIQVNKLSSDKEIRSAVDNATIALQTRQIDALNAAQKSGIPIMESDELIESIYEKLLDIRSNYHNVIARNLLIALGCRSAMRRIGDVYTRMDAVYASADHCFGAIEVEFGSDALDTSRGILDDIAVLHTRYGIEKDRNKPLAIYLQLPTAQKGYWQVVKDIKAVEDIVISTITVGALMLLNWNGCLLIPDDATYYRDYDNMSLRSVVSWQIGRDVQLSDKLLGILEPMK